MRIKSVSLAFLLAALPAAAICAILSSELTPQPDQETNEVEHRLERCSYRARLRQRELVIAGKRESTARNHDHCHSFATLPSGAGNRAGGGGRVCPAGAPSAARAEAPGLLRPRDQRRVDAGNSQRDEGFLGPRQRRLAFGPTRSRPPCTSQRSVRTDLWDQLSCRSKPGEGGSLSSERAYLTSDEARGERENSTGLGGTQHRH